MNKTTYEVIYYFGDYECPFMFFLPDQEDFIKRALERDQSMGLPGRLDLVTAQCEAIYRKMYSNSVEFAIWYFANFINGGVKIKSCKRV